MADATVMEIAMPDMPSDRVLDYGEKPPLHRLRLRRRHALWIVLISAAIAIFLSVPLISAYRIHMHAVNSVTCGTNLRQIHSWLGSYVNRHDGWLPDSLESLAKDALESGQPLDTAVFVCPNSSDSPASGATTTEVLADLKAPGHISYVYLVAGKRYSELDDDFFVLAYHPNNDCCNVLYADHHVERPSGAEAKWVIAELKAGRNPPRPFGATSQPSSWGQKTVTVYRPA